MSEPVSSVLGMKASPIVAGFLGSLIRLSYAQPMKHYQLIIAVLSGTVTAAYITPLVMLYFTLPEKAEDGLSFVIGLFAMGVVPKLVNLGEDPVKFWNQLKSGGAK